MSGLEWPIVGNFAGEFETHVTVRAGDPARLDALRAWADDRGMKFHHIVLDRGLTPSQPMVTRRGRGDLTGQLAAAEDLMAGLAAIIYVSRFDTAKADAGTGFELDVITAVVVGGTSIYGGRGNIVGTVLGLLLIHETRQFVGRQWQIDELKSIVVGLLLIGSLLLYRAMRTQDRD